MSTLQERLRALACNITDGDYDKPLLSQSTCFDAANKLDEHERTLSDLRQELNKEMSKRIQLQCRLDQRWGLRQELAELLGVSDKADTEDGGIPKAVEKVKEMQREIDNLKGMRW